MEIEYIKRKKAFARKIAFSRSRGVWEPPRAGAHLLGHGTVSDVQPWLDGRMEHVGHDNGSEFQGHFRETCAQFGIPQYHSRVKTPKDNATNERFNRTLQEEFLHFDNRTDDVGALQPQTPPVARRVQRPPAAPELGVCDTDVVHPEARERDTEVVILYKRLTNSRKNVSPAALLLAVRACDGS